MKKIFLLFLAVATISLTSCSDDDEAAGAVAITSANLNALGTVTYRSFTLASVIDRDGSTDTDAQIISNVDAENAGITLTFTGTNNVIISDGSFALPATYTISGTNMTVNFLGDVETFTGVSIDNNQFSYNNNYGVDSTDGNSVIEVSGRFLYN